MQRGDARVLRLYGKHSGSQLSSTWVSGFVWASNRTRILATFQLKSVVGTLVVELCREGTNSSETSCVDVLEFELRRSTVRRFGMDCGVMVSFIYEVAYLTDTVSFGILRLICVSFGITRLICVSFGITRLIYVFFRDHDTDMCILWDH
ncbi:hypothetical protein E5676_scaffold265G002930 [Cucumis melo var. makuwa]|uniref:Transmembrane protein n=1 Tax=Cucumis melo var. makuwa TaxID=1194695 RepID=A0A5D3C9U4_CUCMM|nr:hypothetical protein E5676_scaffold265G002930 [Cucumis melo var. makuwa]